MDGVNTAMLWWSVAGGLVVAEIVLGFSVLYLLMFALGAAAGAVAAHLDLGLVVQITSAAITAFVATLALHRFRPRRNQQVAVNANPDAHIDVGMQLIVPDSELVSQGRVMYRGSQWPARTDDGSPLSAGTYRIAALDHIQLVLSRS